MRAKGIGRAAISKLPYFGGDFSDEDALKREKG
jgi:hypothetical protein